MLKALIIGNLGRDCTVNQVSGKSVINFSVAHTEKNKDGQSKTTWVECAYWTDKTGIAPYLKTGVQVYVEGFPEIKTYTKKDGSGQGVSFTVRVQSVQLLGGKSEGQASQQPQQAVSASINDNPDDLPF